MVFFNCNSCGEALKKNQVEKHYQFKCRSCTVLSCVDCQKDFPGDTYKEHTKCISEEEKYSGKNWKPKANVNKGEQKQEAWIEQVIAAIEKCRAKPQLKALLQRIQDYPNIPRKQAKFENFVKNSMGVRQAYLIEEAWSVLSAEMNAKSKPEEKVPEPSLDDTAKSAAANDEANDDHVDEKKLNKRERKEARSKKQHKIEKKQQKDTKEEEVKKSKKKQKKRKREETEEEEVSSEDEEEEMSKKKKKGKNRETEEEAPEDVEEDVVKPEKFHWDVSVMGLLEKADGEAILLKKLRKKLLAEFQSRGGDGNTFTEERFMSKFNKKVLKNPKYKVYKERIKLRH